MNNLLNKQFNDYVSIDAVPEGRTCESCERPAIHRCLVTGGIFHCQTGIFCGACAKHYADHVERVSKLTAALAASGPMDPYDWMFRVHNCIPAEQGVWNAAAKPVENHEEEIVTLEDFKRWMSGRYAQ